MNMPSVFTPALFATSIARCVPGTSRQGKVRFRPCRPSLGMSQQFASDRGKK